MLIDIGWLWGLVFAANTVLIYYVSLIYIFMYPVLATICLYFTYMRYDEEGNRIA